MDNRQVLGDIFTLYQQAQASLLEHIRIAGKVEEGSFERTDTPAYPLEALREALANALCHRDYAEAGGAIDLAIYDDRIEIVSSGPLRFGMTVEDLVQEHQSRPWNPIIAQVLYKRGMIESWGRGTLKMIEAARNVGLIAPEFVNTNLSFTVRFRAEEYVPPTRVSHDLTELQREILSKLRSLGPSTSTTVANAMTDASDQRAVLRNLQALRDYGLVTLTGQYKAARWRLAHDLLENP
ncbi:MAG: ATP-binding protein [Thermomicrobiales bacterium]